MSLLNPLSCIKILRTELAALELKSLKGRFVGQHNVSQLKLDGFLQTLFHPFFFSIRLRIFIWNAQFGFPGRQGKTLQLLGNLIRCLLEIRKALAKRPIGYAIGFAVRFFSDVSEFGRRYQCIILN